MCVREKGCKIACGQVAEDGSSMSIYTAIVRTREYFEGVYASRVLLRQTGQPLCHLQYCPRRMNVHFLHEPPITQISVKVTGYV
jgi:hypothetical protein